MHKARSAFARVSQFLSGIPMLPGFMLLASRYVDRRDDWDFVSCQVPDYMFGTGYQGSFAWYLQGESHVQAQTIEEICAWLANCEYDNDRGPDWSGDACQHPRDFEQTRKGVCVDHAIWAWRKLVENGYDAEYVVGSMNSEPGRSHAWVVFESAGCRFNLESALKVPVDMVKPVEEVREAYSPHCSVNGMLVRKAYGGMYRYLKHRRNKRLRSRHKNQESALR